MSVIRITPMQHLNSFNVFDIGLNKEYLNTGLIQHENRSTLVHQLKELDQKIRNEPANHTLAFSGDLIEFLADEQPELLATFAAHAQSGLVQLGTQSYHGALAELMHEQHYMQQVLEHQEALQKYFGVPASVLVSSREPTVDLQQKTGVDGHVPLAETQSLAEFLHAQEDSKELRTDMQEHLLEEMASMSKHVHETEDAELIGAFCKLASPEVIKHSHPEHGEAPYDHYTTLMSILHDVAHRITVARQIKKGIFVTEPQFGPSPSALLER